MKFIKKIANFITNTLLIVIIIAIFFALYGMFQIKVLNNKYINYFGYTFFEVVSGSMSPTINTYDLVIIKVGADFKENDVITFYKDNSFITHRVIGYNEEQILTKGDANNTSDKYITKDMVVGKVIYIIQEFGIIKRVLVNSKVIFWIFLTFILFSLAFSICDKKGEVDEK